MKPGAIFISYTHEDQAAALRLRDFLENEARIDGLDRPPSARGWRRLGSPDPPQHQELLVFHAGNLGGVDAAAGGLFPP